MFSAKSEEGEGQLHAELAEHWMPVSQLQDHLSRTVAQVWQEEQQDIEDQKERGARQFEIEKCGLYSHNVRFYFSKPATAQDRACAIA